MNIDQKIIERFENLVAEGESVLGTQHNIEGIISWDSYVNSKLSSEWGSKALNLLSRVFTKESDYYQKFDTLFVKFDHYTPVLKGQGILKGAKDDYENGYLFDVKELIRAEVFGDFLEQAEYLLKKGFHQPAAVVAVCVLEDGLRQLCAKNEIDLSKADSMNNDLAKAGVYNKNMQKAVAASLGVRNSAAHGNHDQFDAEDVKRTVSQVQTFMQKFFS